MSQIKVQPLYSHKDVGKPKSKDKTCIKAGREKSCSGSMAKFGNFHNSNDLERDAMGASHLLVNHKFQRSESFLQDHSQPINHQPSAVAA
jgi:hypothetical protein